MKKSLTLLCLAAMPLMSMGQDPAPPPQWTFDIYGFVMTDVIYNVNQEDPLWQDGLRPTKLPTFEDDPSYTAGGTMYFGVRQSRIGFKSTTQTSLGEFKTQFEWELYGTGGDAGQTTPRLRHAYGQLGKFGAGQTWSPFMDIDVFPNSIEYWGPTGMVFFRNIQVRYMPIQGPTFATIALERPGGSADGQSYSEVQQLNDVRDQFSFPDLSAEYRRAMDWGYIEAAGILRYIGWKDMNTTDGNDMTDNTLGYGINITSNIKLGTKSTVRLAFVYGEGIQNYMNDATTDIAVKADPDNVSKPFTGEALPMFGGVAFIDVQWNEKFSSSFWWFHDPD